MDETRRNTLEKMKNIEKQLTQEERNILFSDFPETSEFDRETIEKYSSNPSDVRIAAGRFYTPREMNERAKKAFSVRLY